MPGFECATLDAGTAADGPVELVLVRHAADPAGPPVQAGVAVLYLHGFVDYFFQRHLADFYREQGLRFYALDLRRHGRAWRRHQLPNYTADLDEYLQDVNQAVAVLQAHEGVRQLILNGHSTGGLVAALYAHRGERRATVRGVFLNSPFLDMNLPRWQQRWVEPALAALGAWWPRLRVPGLRSVYGQSLHADHHGQWRYDTRWKPIGGLPVHAGWFRAIHRAHAEVAAGLTIACPVLVLHAKRSLRPRGWTEQAMSSDVVLDVADIARLAPRLGTHVQCDAIDDGVHDLTLSAAPARHALWVRLAAWLRESAPADAP